MKENFRLTRRSALLLPLVLGGCSIWDDWFGETKKPLPGKRIDVMDFRAPKADADMPAVKLPAPEVNAEWAQAGGVPTHAMGHPQVADALHRAWQSDIGESGGYRRKITARPVVAGGRVFAMDSDATVSAYSAASGARIWRTDTQPEHDRSSNFGGGIAFDDNTLYVGTGRAEVLALDAATGKIRWRVDVSNPVRAAPTISGDRLFVATLDAQLHALSTKDGTHLWAYQAPLPETAVLDLPSPAVSDGIVVAGFATGDLVAVRASSGSVVWADSLAAIGGRISMVDFSAIAGMPVISNGRVYVGSMGSLLVCNDLRSGRRLWQRDIATAETPWLAGDWLFVLSTQAELMAISAEDGRIGWTCQLPLWGDAEKRTDRITWMGPVLAGDRLVLASSDSHAASVSPYTGKILGRQDLPDSISVPPVVAGGSVYFVCADASLTAWR